MRLFHTLTASLVLFGAVGSAQAQQVNWLPVQNSDLIATSLEQQLRHVPDSLHSERQPLQFAWRPDDAGPGRADAARSISESPAISRAISGATTESRQYWLDATGADLALGLTLPISAAGAVIRVSALAADSELRLDPAALSLAMDGEPIAARFGPDQLATGRDLRDQGMRVPESTLAFRLFDHVGPGALSLSLHGLPSDQAVVVHVFEPNSPWIARLALPRHNFLSGQALDFDFALGDGRVEAELRSLQAVLVSPDASQSWAIGSERDAALSLSAAPLASRSGPVQGLYEAHVYVEAEVDGLIIRRDLSLALNIAPALARFNGQAALAGTRAGQALVLGIDTAVDGRFQVNAELWGADERGQMRALGYVQSAAELSAGGGAISFDLDPALAEKAGRLEVRNLQLLDQGRMFLLEDRAEALEITL